MIKLINASAHDTGLDALSVHCIVTSPPYWGLRAYAGEQRIEWAEVEYSPMPGLPALSIPAMTCGLGEETTPEAYIGHLILVMREMWRVLRDDGTCFVNLGDSYASDIKGSGGPSKKQTRNAGSFYSVSQRLDHGKLKPKDLCLIPARFALAAQADGWYIRNDIIWAKPNPMPESVTDRCTKAHEYVWLMAKSQRYFYDAEAVKEGFATADETSPSYRANGKSDSRVKDKLGGKPAFGDEGAWFPTGSGRNRRTVWNIATSPYSGAHFATWPPKLVEPMIQAGTSARGVCPTCGSPWERVVEREIIYSPREVMSNTNRGTETGGMSVNETGEPQPQPAGVPPANAHPPTPSPLRYLIPLMEVAHLEPSHLTWAAPT
jgi:DNA modification methylase